MNAKNRISILGIVLAVMLVFANLDALAVSYSSNLSGSSGNWNDSSTWTPAGIPTDADDVTITAGDTVVVTNTSGSPAEVDNLTVGGVLRPDIGTRYIEVYGDLLVSLGGEVHYSFSSGRLNWTFFANDGTETIRNNNMVTPTEAEADLCQFNDVTIAGTMKSHSGDEGSFTVFGDWTVNGLGDWESQGGSIIYFSNSAAKTISNAASCVFESIYVIDNSTVNTSAELTVNDDLNIESGSALNVSTALGILTIGTDGGTSTITSDGTFTIGSSSELVVDGTTELATDLNGISGQITVNAGETFDLSTYDLNGTGAITTGSGSTLILENSNGVAGAILLTGSNSLNNNTNYTFEGTSTTGFAGLSITQVGNLVIGAGTGSASLSTSESFQVNGDFTVTVTAGTNQFTAASGTITFAGSGKSINNAEATASQCDFNSIDFATGSSYTQTGATGFTIGGDLTTTGTGSFVPASATTCSITFDGTSTLTNNGTLTPSQWTITGEFTLGSDLTFADVGGATGDLTLNGASAFIDAADNDFDLSGTDPSLTLTAGTFKTSDAAGVAGNFTNLDANTELVVAATINYEYYGSAPTTLGWTFANISGAGQSGNTDINAAADVTIGGSCNIISTGTTNAITRTLSGDLTVDGTATLILPYSTTDDLLAFNGTCAIAVNSTTDPALTFNYLTIAGGTVTSSADYSIVGILVRSGGTFTNTNNIVTLTPGASMDSPQGTSITFNDLNVTGANNIAPTTGTTISVTGDLVKDDAGTLDFSGGANTVTFDGASTLYKTNDAGDVTFFDVTVSASNSLNASAAGLTSTVNGIDLNTSLVGDFDVADGGTMTVAGTFTAATGQTVDFLDTGTGSTIAGAGTKTFYNLVFSGTGTLASAVNMTVANDLEVTGTGTWTATGGTITMTGAAGTLNTSTAVTDLTLNTGNLTIDNGAVITFTGNGITATGAATVTVAAGGKAIMNDSPTIDGTGVFTSAAGSTLEFGTSADVGLDDVLDFATLTETVTAGTDIIIGAAVTDAGLDVATVTGLGNPDDITIDATGLTDMGGAVLTFSGNLVVSGAADYTEGTACTVTMSGTGKTITNSGTLSFDKLVITGTISTSSSFILNNVSTGGNLINVSAGSFTASDGTVTLEGDGAIANSATLTFNNLTVDGADVTTTADFTIAGDVVITNAGDLLEATAGEITLSDGTGTITTAADFATGTAGLGFFDVDVTGSYTQAGAHEIMFDGDLTVSGSMTFAATSEAHFSGAASTITNNGTLVFGSIEFDASATGAGTATGFEVATNWTMGAAGSVFTATGGEIELSGTGNMTTAANNNLAFNDLSVTGTITHVGDHVWDINGDFDVTGSYDANQLGTLNLDAGTTQEISVSSPLILNNLTVGANTKLETSSDITVEGVLTLSAATSSLDASGGGTFTFTDASAATTVIALSTTSASSVKFYSIVANSTNNMNITSGKSFQLYGDLTNSNTGDFDIENAGTGKVTMLGTDEQTITVSSTGTIEIYDLTLNNSNGASLAGDIADDELLITGTLRLQDGDIDLNGNNILTIDNSGTARLSETPGNTVLNSGTETSTGYVAVRTYAPGGAITNENVGGLGAKLTTSADPGNVTVKRYHIPRTVGGDDGISRYYSITTSGSGLDATLTFLYDESELNSLTESELELLRADDETGPWTLDDGVTKDAANNLLRLTGIDQFTAAYEFWTAGVPSIVTATSLTKGLASSPLTAGTLNQGIYGLQLTTTSGEVTLTDLTIAFEEFEATAQLDSLRFWLSEDDDFSTSVDNTYLDAETTLDGVNSVTFTSFASSVVIEPGIPVNLFVGAYVKTTVTTSNDSIQGMIDQDDITLTGGVMESVADTGTAYYFEAGLSFGEVFAGVHESPLTAGQDDAPIFGFQATSTSAITDFQMFELDFGSAFTGKVDWSTLRLFRSTDGVYTAGSETEVTVSLDSLNTTTVKFDFSADQQALNTTGYFYITVDVEGGVTASTASITPTILHSTMDAVSAGPRFLDIDGNDATVLTSFTYDFIEASVTIADYNGANDVPAGNLGQGVRNSSIYAFVVEPESGTTFTFDSLVATVMLDGDAVAGDFSNYKLWYDANLNGFGDAGEQISSGTYNTALSQGNLTFGLSTAQSFSADRQFLITTNVSSSATVDGTIQIEIKEKSYFKNGSIPPAAKFLNAGPYTGNIMTVKAPGAASQLEIIPSELVVETGSSLSFAVRALDASGIPANITGGNKTITINDVSGSTTLGTTTGTLINGSNYISITSTLTNAAGTTTENIYASTTGLTNDTTANITILTDASGIGTPSLTLGSATATTFVISGISAGSGAGRLIVVKAITPPADPTDGTTYSGQNNLANSTAANQQTDPGSYVVSAGSGTSNVSVLGLVPGTKYYVEIFEYAGSGGTINYNTTATTLASITTTSPDTTDPFGSHSTFATASNVVVNTNVSGAIDVSGQEDYFRFNVPAGKTNIRIRLTGLPANYSLDLYDSAQNLLRTTAIAGTTSETIIINDLTAGGPYYIKVYGADSSQFSSSSYTLRVEVSGDEFLSHTN